MINLISNAIKFTEKCEMRLVNVSLYILERSLTMFTLQLEIKDTGLAFFTFSQLERSWDDGGRAKSNI